MAASADADAARPPPGADEESAVQHAVFDNRFQTGRPPVYFHHVVNAVSGSLTAQVLGLGLSFVFRHGRGLQTVGAAELAARLERKTTGFLALVRPTGRRVVLAWAESGHGCGPGGDVLNAGAGALANDIWTRRTLAVAAALGLRMDRPFDGRVAPRRGVFLASHVEVKLAVHAIFLLLRVFGDGGGGVSRAALRRLRRARWDDGSRPCFEIQFSRRHCAACGVFVRALAALTGVEMGLVWRTRLGPVAYHAQSGSEPRAPAVVNLTEATPLPRTNDSFLDGLAYRVGQAERDPALARAAVVDLAKRARGISKPLPATPATEPPAWMRLSDAVQPRLSRPYSFGGGERVVVVEKVGV